MIIQTIIWNNQEIPYNSQSTPSEIAEIYGYSRGEYDGINLNEFSLKRYTETELQNIYMGSLEGIVPISLAIIDEKGYTVIAIDAFVRTIITKEVA